MADAYLHRRGLPPFEWGGLDLDAATESRAQYIATLRAADAGDDATTHRFRRSTRRRDRAMSLCKPPPRRERHGRQGPLVRAR
jgi:hypothetical protein